MTKYHNCRRHHKPLLQTVFRHSARTILGGWLLMAASGPGLAQQTTVGPEIQPEPPVAAHDPAAGEASPVPESSAARIVRPLPLPPLERTRQAPSLLSYAETPPTSRKGGDRPKSADAEHDQEVSDPNKDPGHSSQTVSVDSAQRQQTRYVIQSGDTLATIFKRQGLSAGTLQQLLATSKTVAHRLARIRPGQILLLERSSPNGPLLKLTLVAKDGPMLSIDLPGAHDDADDHAAGPQASQRIRYRVKKGDTLSSIFSRHGIPARTLQRLLTHHKQWARELARLRPGQWIELELKTQHGRLLGVTLERTGHKPLVLHLRSTEAPLPEAGKLDSSIAQTSPPRSSKPAATASDVGPETPAAQAVGDAELEPAEPKVATPAYRTLSYEIKKGDSLAGIFQRVGLTGSKLYEVLHSGEVAKGLARIRPGQHLEFSFDQDGGLLTLSLVRNPIEKLVVTRQADGYQARLEKKTVERRLATASGVIHSSLFDDGQEAGLSDAQVMELAEIFGWDIDFALEIQPGDQFRVVYEEQFVDGEKYRNGPILAAEFVNHGKTYQAFRFEHDGQIGYYDADGHSKRRAFIRTPIRFARISSRFTRRRWHPVLKRWKSHKGVDYAAPTGTPIKVTGDGRVIFRGWKRGYGRVVIVQHSPKYSTLYAHMSKFRSSVKQGSRVRQGQVIGYVGSSGWATGPHLHYEFRVNNVQRNPLTVKLPRALPLPKRQLAAFKRQTAPLMRQLAAIRAKSMVASSAH